MNETGQKLLQQRIDERRQLGQAFGIRARNIVVTDEYLDFMAERFMRLRIRELTRASFLQYLHFPNTFEAYAKVLKDGSALQFNEGEHSVFVLPPTIGWHTYWH